MQAIDVLLSHGVHEEKILFLNLVRKPPPPHGNEEAPY